MKKTTEQSIIDTAKGLFWKHGIKRVTVEEIAKEAGVSKTTYYRMFSNKEDVAERVLDAILENGLREYKSIMARDIPFSEKIKQVVEMKHTASKGISNEFLKDIMSDHSGLRNRLVEERKNTELMFIKDLRSAQKKGWIRKDLKIEFIHYMLNLFNEKIMDDTFLALFEDSDDAIMEIINFFFYGILTTDHESE
ncbi:TetR/AcrR family transcriptional regulator [Membranicola marinus]|uniref:TetR/AcrR family transcriptional regulator n=1 Tax=Membranihabitans marinus TaxID=1227546 RepID=A0A953I0V7_9BACT|nr:TetR/AcrR family transcriptional regulator [Membranihabitans marinus]MBY5959222.1 TetR/AcrR family transcriptional regulator [Membranihabitans marinus]